MDKEQRQALAQEKLHLGAIRSLKEDDRFMRYLAMVRIRFEATDSVIDTIDPEDVKGIAELKGIRKAYRHELFIIDSCEDRIKEIDGLLSEDNKRVKHRGNEGGGRASAPPEE